MANMSTFVAPLYTVDQFQEHFEISSFDIPNVQRYQTLLLQASRSEAEDLEMANLAEVLKSKLLNSSDFNYFQDCLQNMQLFIKDNVEGYVETQKLLFNAEINKFNYVGSYNASTQYYVKNIVGYAGNLYLCILDSINHVPSGDVSDIYFTILSRKGEKGDVGLSLAYKGEYNNATSYVVGDAVSYFSVLYYCKASTVGNLPTSTNFWTVFDKVIINNNPPSSPVPNQMWVDTINNLVKYWDGSIWVATNSYGVTNGTLTFTATDINNIKNSVTELAGAGRTTETVKKNADDIAVLNGAGAIVEKTSKTVYDTHLADYVRQPGYAVTTGSANIYAVTLNPVPTAYVDGMGITVRINATSTGALTFNVNGLGAKAGVDSKGNAFSATKTLLAGSRYTFRYSAVAGNFQLQGEGGSGNALASDLLSGKTATTDAGDIVGTRVVNGALGGTIATQGGTYVIPSGDTTGGTVTANITNLVESNIVNTATVGGIVGTAINASTVIAGETKWGTTKGGGVPNGMTPLYINGFQIVGVSGTVRVKYFIDDFNAYTAKIQVYKNGSPLGVLHTVTAPTNFTEDYAVTAGDYIQIYACNGTASSGVTSASIAIHISQALPNIV